MLRRLFPFVAIVLAGCVAPQGDGDADIGVTQAALFSGGGSVNREATVYQDVTGNNGGGYADVCVGNLASSVTTRRAFVRYTLPAIPAGAQITRVRLVFTQDRVRIMGAGVPKTATLRLNRITSSWSEGSGMSAALRSCAPGADVAGVDWASQPSVSAFTSGDEALTTANLSTVTFDTDIGSDDNRLISDVQAWVDGTTNHGWRLRVTGETTFDNARSLDPGALTVWWTRANGGTCDFDNDCNSGNCVHPDESNCGGRSGCVCCSAATCTGICQTCFRSGAVGTCGAQVSSVVCRSASCSGGTETLEATCTGSSQSCPSVSTNPCTPFVCGATACRTSCTNDSQCVGTSFCNGSNLCEFISDECAQGLDDCVRNSTCVDPTVAIGDFTCPCNSGYSGDGHPLPRGTGCTDDDECALGTAGCDTNATCMNTAGSFTCTCNGPQWIGSGMVCTDYDECGDPFYTAMCDINATCRNLTGSFECNCDTGYRGTGIACTEINECAEGTDDCHADANCTNTPGSWSCSCNPGYAGDGVTCADVDECLDPMFSGRCSTVAACNNLIGDWECVCVEGYRGDGFACDDVDECTEGTDTCHADATCLNEIGAFTCTCNGGYSGSGFDCTDIDECAEGTHGCVGNETCVNEVGRVNSCVCRPGFMRPDAESECVRSCGDGFVTPGEGCDDGNLDDGDGCSAICDIEPGWACYEPTGTESTCNMTCGDRFIDTGEECDDGADNDDALPDACRTTCQRAGCGDETLDTGEECDDGASNDDTAADACRTTCNLAYCGDGVIDTGEVCDVGGGEPGAATPGQCTTMCVSDAGTDGGEAPMDGGCACRSAGPGSPAPWGLALGLFGGLFFVRRRRR